VLVRIVWIVEVTIDMNIVLFCSVLLLLISSNLIAQETGTQTSERSDKWLKRQDIQLKDEVSAYKDQNSTEETLELTEVTEPFEQQFDFNEMVREKMVWDKRLSSEKSYLDRCRLSVGVIKVDKLMGGAMLKVKLFN
jgi:hypothetical protein